MNCEIIEAFISNSRYLNDLLHVNIDKTYLEDMIGRIYPSELHLNKAKWSDTEVPFLDLHLTISDGFLSSKIYDKREDFDFDILRRKLIVLHVTRHIYPSSFGVLEYLSSNAADFNTGN